MFLWFSYGFPMVFLWFSYGFPVVFRWNRPISFDENTASGVIQHPLKDHLGVEGESTWFIPGWLCMYIIYIYIYNINIIHICIYIYIYDYIYNIYIIIYIYNYCMVYIIYICIYIYVYYILYHYMPMLITKILHEIIIFCRMVELNPQ